LTDQHYLVYLVTSRLPRTIIWLLGFIWLPGSCLVTK